jgi:hypothetical protein
MGELFEALQTYFRVVGWPFIVDPDDTVLQLEHAGQQGKWLCYAHAREAQQQLAFYSIYPDLIPSEQRSAVAEVLTRANYGLIIGNFELDLGDGEVRYKTSVDVEGTRLTIPLIRQVVNLNVATMDRYWPAIQDALAGVAPAEALRRVEAATASP